MAEQVIKPLQKGVSADTPEQLDTPGKRALYSNLRLTLDPFTNIRVMDADPAVQLALDIDRTVKEVRPADWRGNTSRENIIKAALLPLLGNDKNEVERIFLIVTAQREY